MIRAEPLPAASPSPPRVPAWALPAGPVEHETDAAFFVGAALNSLDFSVSSEPTWAGAWRQRLALKCAAAAVRLAGRSEDEAALRDAWYLRPADGDPGPAGRILAAWRQLASRPPAIDAERVAEVVELLGLRWDDGFADLPGAVDDLIRSGRPAPFAVAAVASRIVSVSPGAELLAWWCADLVLAQKLRWLRPVPLLMAKVFSPAFRTSDDRGKRIRPGEQKEFERAVCLALAQGADDALRLAADLSRRAGRLAAVVPKLRAKGAGEVVKKLLDDDAVPGSLTTKTLSRFGARRLFERLQTFEAVRELSGRDSFRLFGL
ncbi:DUF1403 family protein (plasmid) [Mesorhizobium sp. NBSH29]|uniref:DUF1403 family protein n=1 Tax=Mesorhizobium sp. NBSH29 TaxID=2654249 RepID=UPI00189693E2|nr:DUF1403 family protein [Mesorhizobium sp. NBSH29]QPC88817.1 DUF1403 family protein [Mesorhizobium sp. NBSH29]QPC88943.1 DUF1403 family protein [Mesorhizobium sp. NBSH29]